MVTKNRKITLIIFLIFLMILGISPVFADSFPKIRELPSKSVSLDNDVFRNNNSNIIKSKDIAKKLEKNVNTTNYSDSVSLKGGISEIKAIVGKEVVVKFDKPIIRVSIANDFADFKVISPTELLINGRKSGETSLIVWGEKGDAVVFNLFIQSSSVNLKQSFLNEVKKIAPYEDVKIDFVSTGTDEKGNSSDSAKLKVIMTGKLSSKTINDRIKGLAESYGFNLIDMTESLTPQVMISLKIVEINRTKLKKKVSDYSHGSSSDTYMKDTFGREKYAEEQIPVYQSQPIYGDPANPDRITAYDQIPTGNYTTKTYTGNKAVNFLAQFLDEGEQVMSKQTTFDNNGFSFWKWSFDNGGETSQIVQSLRMAENEGVAQILAEPKLMAINDQQATFQAGSDIPTPSGRDEYGRLTVEYKKIGINVMFKPIILENSGRILLEINPDMTEVAVDIATPTIEGFPVYTFKTRNTKTKVELQDNETMVIGGLVQKRAISSKTKVPYIGNMPIVQNLLSLFNFLNISDLKVFKYPKVMGYDLSQKFGNLGNLSNNYSNNQEDTELMIFVTPTIVKPDASINGV